MLSFHNFSLSKRPLLPEHPEFQALAKQREQLEHLLSQHKTHVVMCRRVQAWGCFSKCPFRIPNFLVIRIYLQAYKTKPQTLKPEQGLRLREQGFGIRV